MKSLKSRQRGFLLNPARFGGGGGGGADPNFANVVLLCHFDGTDGSTTITDNGPSPKTLTANADAQIDTAQSKFGGASALFDGTGDYISTPDSADFNFGSGAFTVECWVRFSSLTGTQSICGQVGSAGTNDTVSFVLQKDSSNKIVGFGCQTTTQVATATSTSSVTTGVWYHIVYTRSSDTFRLFIDGLIEATVTQATTLNNSTAALGIGRLGDFNGQYLNGHIDDLRITKGVGRYTANFTPPTAAYPNS